MKNIIAVLLFAFTLVGCAAGRGPVYPRVGSSFEWDRAKQVKVGTTEAELIELIGKPYSVMTKADGTQTWIWSYAEMYTGKTGMVSFSLKDRKVTAIPNMEPFN